MQTLDRLVEPNKFVVENTCKKREIWQADMRQKKSRWRLGRGNPRDEGWLRGSVNDEMGRQADNPETGRQTN